MDHSTTEFTRYKDYTLEVNPPRLDKKQWGTFLVISRNRPESAKRRAKRRVFDDQNTFSNRLDAVRHCVDLARKIIDGEFPDRSVSDL